MIKLTATALIHYISPVMQVSDNFQKRELILDGSWEKDGKMPMLDNFTPGQRVTVDAYVNGREYQGRYFNSIKGMGIVPYQASSTVGQRPAQPAPGSYPQQPTYPQAPGAYQQGGYPQAPGGYPQQPAYPQQAAYPQQGSYAQPPAPAPMPASPQGGNLGPDGLPFR